MSLKSNPVTLVKASVMTECTASILESVQDTFNFSVDKFPLMGPDNIKTPYFGLCRSDTMEWVSDQSVSKVYVPHTTEDVVALVEAAQSVFEGEHEAKCHWRKGHYVSVMPSDEHRRDIFGSKDNVLPRMLIRAAYDGKSFRATLGCFRDMCKNLIMLQSVAGITVNIRHSGGLRQKMDALIDDFSQFDGGWENIVAQIEVMEGREVAITQYLDAIYRPPAAGVTGREATIHENRTKLILERLLRERIKSGRDNPLEFQKVTAWEAYNAVQGHVLHDASRSKKSTPFDRAILCHADKKVLQAENLALTMVS